MTTAAQPRIDVAIITIRPDEHDAVFARLANAEILHRKLAYHIAEVTTAHGRVRVALTRADQQGNTHAQDTAHKVIEDLAPKWLLVVGIGGGFPSDDYTLGDVIVSSRFIDWTREAVTEDGVDWDISGGLLESAARRVVALIPTIATNATIGSWNDTTAIGKRRPSIDFGNPTFKTRDETWRNAIARSLEFHARHPRAEPVMIPGPVVASDRLVKSGVYAKDLKHFARSSVAVEMESWGIYVATDQRTPFLAIRGISDIIGLDRNDDWTKYACETCAAFALHLIKSGQLQASLFVYADAPISTGVSPRAASVVGQSVSTALANINAFGDTDVLPFPFELQAFRERPEQASTLVHDYVAHFDERFSNFPPQHERGLVRAGGAGFRWVTQMDPLWNASFLSMVLSLAPEIESRRLPVSDRAVFSYRFSPSEDTGGLFADAQSWPEFRASVSDLSSVFAFAVRTDIGDFYPRISHARLKQQLTSCDPPGTTADRILRFLGNYSNRMGVGLPVGGPAARILAEVALDDVDHILASRRLRFVRFVDDYVLFAQSSEEAHGALSALASLLYQHEGLSLQKMKTRTMSSAELRASLMIDADPDVDHEAVSFLRVPLRYNPYSPTAGEDYDALRTVVHQHDIIGMLAREMNKTRVHEQLTRRLVQAVRFLDDSAKNAAALTLVDALDLLEPLLPTVFIVLRQIHKELTASSQKYIAQRIREVLGTGALLRKRVNSWRLALDSEKAFALRVLALSATAADDALLQQLLTTTTSAMLRRDIILLRLQTGARHFLEELFTSFGQLSRWERRAALAGTCFHGARGRELREHPTDLDPFERFVVEWIGARSTGTTLI